MHIFKSKAREERKQKLLKMLQNGAKIVDVRSPEEFAGGKVIGSTNVPLAQIPQHEEEFRAYTSPIILCCASGNRSGQATEYLRSKGISCENGGSWKGLSKLI